MEVKLGLKEKEDEKDKLKEASESKAQRQAKTPRKPAESSRRQEMNETDYFEKLKDKIIESFGNINQTLLDKGDRKALKEEFREIYELSTKSTSFDGHHQAVVDE